MKQTYGILLTLLAGLFFLLGGFLSLKAKNKEKFNQFSIGLAFIIILGLLFFDLIPEVFELFEGYRMASKVGYSILFIIIGLLSLKILDLFIPDHHHDHHEINDNKKEHVSHMKHIGLLTLISLSLHNILEGFAIVGVVVHSIKAGVFASFGIALHNVALGTTIFSSMNVKENKGYLVILTLSSLFGGLLYLCVGEISNFILASITLITLGMLLYIALFELLGEVIHHIKNKPTIYGMVIGIILIGLSFFI